MKHNIILLLVLFISIIGGASAQKWKEIKTVEDVFLAYPDVLKKMFEELNLEHPGLEKVKNAWQAEDLTEAGKQLLLYYKNSNNAPHLRRDIPSASNHTEAEADTILKNVFVIQNVRGQVPIGEDGHRDWYYKGPNNDREWAWLSNRHSQLSHVFEVYFQTGNQKYAEYIDLFLRDFILKSMPYPGVKGTNSIWRGLEVHSRAKVWSKIFYGFINSDVLSPATRLLMISSLADHAHYNRNFHGGNNWLTMEISALATVATNFPEYKDSDEWLNYSIGAMVESMKDQVYPDGVQTELTSHYHNVSLHNFVLFKEICDRANKPLPEFFTKTIEDMYNYIARAVRPDGNRILNNDGDRGSDRNLILQGAKKFNRPDWEYLATNGKQGSKPQDGPSYVFPWAGQLISRSGYDEDAHWSFFDIGPWGSGHQHNDRLHLSIAAFGRDLLVDAGRFAYTGDVAKKFRPYALGSQGHNVLLIDGNGQAPGPRIASYPLSEKQFKITEEYDYAWSSFDAYKNIEGRVKHTRHLYYDRGNFWIVVDQISTDKPRKIEALWHWHPSCDVQLNGNVVYTNNTRGNLQVIPVGDQKWDINFVKGQEEPEIQGWYSVEYNKYEPNIASIFTTNIESDSRFVWVLYPSDKPGSHVMVEVTAETAEGLHIKVFDGSKKERTVVVPL